MILLFFYLKWIFFLRYQFLPRVRSNPGLDITLCQVCRRVKRKYCINLKKVVQKFCCELLQLNKTYWNCVGLVLYPKFLFGNFRYRIKITVQKYIGTVVKIVCACIIHAYDSMARSVMLPMFKFCIFTGRLFAGLIVSIIASRTFQQAQNFSAANTLFLAQSSKP